LFLPQSPLYLAFTPGETPAAARKGPIASKRPSNPGGRSGEFELTALGTGGTIKMRALKLLPLMLLLLGGCQRGEFTPDAKFVDLYVELKLATVGYANDLEKVNRIRRIILAQHQVTPAEFHAETEKLMTHPDTWRKFQEDVVARVEMVQASHKEGKQEN
jgi:hypothetical protein